MSDLWAEASADIEAEHSALEMTRAKVACASVWPFLAESASEREFSHRLALASDTIAERAGHLYDAVVASLTEDFRAVTAAEQRPGPHRVIEDAHDPELGAHFPAGSEVHVKGHYTDEDGTDWAEVRHGRDSAFLRPEHLVHKDDFSTPESGLKGENGGAAELNRQQHVHDQFLDHALGPVYKPNDFGGHGNAPWGGTQVPDDSVDHRPQSPRYPHPGHDSWVENFDPEDPAHHDLSRAYPGFKAPQTPSGLPIRSLNARGYDEADGEAEDDGPSKAEIAAEDDGDYDYTHADPSYLYSPQSDPWHAKQSRKVAAYFDEGLGQWVAVENPAPGNPAYGESAPEQGPTTGETGTYPQHPTGADPISPLQSEYPAQPQPWTVTPGTEWVERPMNFGPGHAASRLPFSEAYFDGGPEGVAGEQSGFPADVSLPEDEDDRASDFYGAVPPVRSSGTTGDAQDTSYHSARLSSTGNRFFDPADPSVRMVTAADLGFSGEGAGANPNDGATPPPPPPSMTGGPGSAVPQTTSPAQMPGGGGMDAGGGMGDMGAAPGDAGGPKTTTSTATRHQADSQSLFSESDPTGYGDAFKGQQYEKARAARPRMNVEDMHINTPQAPARPIETRTSTSPMQEDDDDEEEEER